MKITVEHMQKRINECVSKNNNDLYNTFDFLNMGFIDKVEAFSDLGSFQLHTDSFETSEYVFSINNETDISMFCVDKRSNLVAEVVQSYSHKMYYTAYFPDENLSKALANFEFDYSESNGGISFWDDIQLKTNGISFPGSGRIFFVKTVPVLTNLEPSSISRNWVIAEIVSTSGERSELLCNVFDEKIGWMWESGEFVKLGIQTFVSYIKV